MIPLKVTFLNCVTSSVSLFIWTYYGVAGNIQNQNDRLVTPVNMASIGYCNQRSEADM
jgi:hypothetical protein